MESARNSDDAAAPRRGKRMITQARKEQNRIAQKLYRQRQREHLQNKQSRSNGLPRLTHALKPRTVNPPVNSSETLVLGTDRASMGDDLSQSDSAVLFAENGLQSNISQPSLDAGLMNHHSSQELASNEDGLAFPTTSPHLFPSMNLDSMLNAYEYGNMLSPTPRIDPNLIEDSGSVDGLLALTSTNVPFIGNFVYNDTSFLSSVSRMQTTLLDNNHLQQEPLLESPSTTASLSFSALNSTNGQAYYAQHTTNLHLECYKTKADNWQDLLVTQHHGVELMIAATSKFLNWCQLHPGSRGPPICSIPDIYANYIHCFQTSTMLAYMHNASCIDLPIKDLITMKSPFYRPNTTMTDDPATLLLEAQKPWIPAHLQPTLPQILFPHHPYLDLIPFPILRARAITLMNTAPWMLNPMELKKDIFTEGLTCYAESTNDSFRGSGQPWDLRSWEAAPWFLTKWRLLVAPSSMF